jgi:hypothetical protein
MAAAFATYLGPYKHSFRRKMLTVHWPECLQERGVPLLLDDAPHTVIETEEQDTDVNEQDTDVNEQDMEVSFIMMTAALVFAYKEVRLF